MDLRSSFEVNATLVANEFIDRYMADANGEYVKVYLYIQRHQREELTPRIIADALNNTEADVKRALLYWEKLGALCVGKETSGPQAELSAAREEGMGASAAREAGNGLSAAGEARTGSPDARKAGTGRFAAGEKGTEPAARTRGTGLPGPRAPMGKEQTERLMGDGDFSQLLYIAQRYMNKIFTQHDLEVFANLYGELGMPAELLEYLVEYCAQNGHTSIRYVETVGLSWHEKGFRTVEEAKGYTSGFTRDSFAVMRAFGLSDRRPGDGEKEMIERWFGSYGFGKELVLEACNRTMEATHTPSFRYADKILSEWKKMGVKSLRDVAQLDEKRRGQKRQTARQAKPKTNQFHNFEQRSTDYDSMVLDQVRDWIGRDEPNR